jgi:hypothetical protein
MIKNLKTAVSTLMIHSNQIDVLSHLHLDAVVGESVCWQFVDVGRHIARDEVNVHAQMSGK